MSEYVYILINSSLPGLLKIGKTSRTPEERAAELSQNTNMPTPFMVAYEEQIPDSTTAEKFIHEELKNQGYRINDSREFFSIPLKEAIQIVSLVASHVREIYEDKNEELLLSEEDDSEATGEYYFSQGMNALSGRRNTLQNFGKAKEHFETAILFGNIRAYNFLASLYITGQGVPQDAETALEILLEGGEKGNRECFNSMWRIYAGNTVLDVFHKQNAEVCFKWFLDASDEEIDSNNFEEYLSWGHRILCDGEYYPPGSIKFPLKQFPVRHASKVVNLWINKIRGGLVHSKELRLSENWKRRPSVIRDLGMDIYSFNNFMSEHVSDSKDIIKKALIGFDIQDLQYIFYTMPKQVDTYKPYLSSGTVIEQHNEFELLDSKAETKKSRGFWHRLWFGSN